MRKTAAASPKLWQLEAAALKPLVLGRVPTCAELPVRDVEIPLGHTRQYSLQLLEPLHVHGSLRKPPPFVSRREPTRLGANCNHPAASPYARFRFRDSSPLHAVQSLSDGIRAG